MKVLRIQDAVVRLAAAREAITSLSVRLHRDEHRERAIQRLVSDFHEAERVSNDIDRLFVRLENLLTIIEWQIERYPSTE